MAAEHTVTDLSTLDWQFGRAPRQPWRATADANARDADRVTEWLPARVPGDVHSDLLALGRIPDPCQAGGLPASRWVEGVDWWYRARLPLAIDPGQRAFIELDGVDTLSAVFVEERELGRREGMFSRHALEIPAELARRPAVELAVRIWGSDALPAFPLNRRERLWKRVISRGQNSMPPFDDRLATLKRPMSFGWDFAPRLRTMGIWDAGRVVVCRGVYVAGLYVAAEPLGQSADGGPARVSVRLVADSDRATDVDARFDLRPAGVGGVSPSQFAFRLHLPAGVSEHRIAFQWDEAPLWQPWERGAPNLCDLSLRLCNADAGSHNLPLATAGTRFGVRRIELGERWQVRVNGQPFFLRGVNWVPLDALPGRVERGRYEALLRQAVAAGVNFVRVWGGGGRETQAFYDLCDELGLLVWQEFPVACVFLDHLPRSAAFASLLRQESRGIVQALHNHPSVALWCGGNEFSASRNRRAVAAMAEVAAAEDGQRPFLAASPGPGDAHNWLVWHGLASLAAYRQEQAALVSEFGLQAAPSPDSLAQFLAGDELWPPGEGWERHNADLRKMRRYAHWFQTPGQEGLAAFVDASQRAQAAGLQVLIEHVRRRKPITGGFALWQWNEPWPSICWSVIDYYGRPKLAYQTLQRIMQPVLVSLDFPLRRYRAGDRLAGALWLVNDGAEEVTDCTLTALLDGVVVQQQRCELWPDRAAAVGALAVTLPADSSQLRLELRRGNALLAENVYDLRFHDGGATALSQRLQRRIVDLILR